MKEIGFDGIMHRLIKDARKRYPSTYFGTDSPGQAVYDIITALRGPDFAYLNREEQFKHGPSHYGDMDLSKYDFDTLKHLTTARLRALVLGPHRVHQYVAGFSGAVITIDPLAPSELTLRNRMLMDVQLQHFRAHYNLGVKRIRELYEYDLQTETGRDNRLRKED